MAFSAAGGCSCTLINRKSISETTFRHGNNHLMSHRWTISSSSRGLMSSSSTRYLGCSSRTRLSTTNDAPPLVRPPKTAPWLMLPPVFEGNNYNNNNLVYQFYTLGENKLIGLKRRNTNDEDEDEEKEVDGYTYRSTIVSSTRGWLALFQKQRRFMFLSNPLSRRHIELPRLDTLNVPMNDWGPEWKCPTKKRNRCHVKQIILSSSNPDDQHFRALTIAGPRNRLGFCHPGHSTEWTPLGDGHGYASCAYSPKQKLFFCTVYATCTNYPDQRLFFGFEDDQEEWPPEEHLEAWDLRDPLSPRHIPMAFSADKDNYPVASRSKEEHHLKASSDHQDDKFLVFAEASDELFHVRRFVTDKKGPHGYYVEDDYYGPELGLDKSVPYKTLGFDVHKYNPETGSLEYMDRSLGGYVFFVGCNDGLALPAAEFPELKPDSIYYTCPPDWADNMGGHDVGIFNYRDNTLSSCYFPPDMQSRKKNCTPKWFTPTPLIRYPVLVENGDGSVSLDSSSSFC